MLGERARPLFEGLHIDAMTERLSMRIVETRRIGEDVRVLLRPETTPVPAPADAATPPPPAD
jgi:diaminohydroxyphosphoribosylaminopyrimidine deaminase/5-amino-6-(5-phosphoribosylamino)uracil reductase